MGPSALGAAVSPGLSHGDLGKQHHRPRLLQPHRRQSQSHDGRRLSSPGERSEGTLGWRLCSSLCPGAGRVLGPVVREARGGTSWVGRVGYKAIARRRRTPTRSSFLWGELRLGSVKELFFLQSGCLEEAREVAAPSSCAFQGFCPRLGLSRTPVSPQYYSLPDPWRGARPE